MVNNNNEQKESRTNTNRLKHLFVCPNNSGLINHLKKENERLRKLVVTYEFKTRKYNEDKLNIRNNNKNYCIIENCLNFTLYNNDDDNNSKEENSEIISLSNKYDRDLITDDLKYNKIDSNINTGNNTNTNANNSKKNDSKLIAKASKNTSNSNQSNGYNKKIFNYTKINNNKNNIKKNGFLGNEKERKLPTFKEMKNNLEKERINSLNQRQKNTNLNNYNNTLNNYNNNSKNKSKQIFNNVKNNNITKFNKKYKDDYLSNSRNQSLGVKRKNNNNSFNDSIREKKIERLPNMDRNAQRNDFAQCQSVLMNTFENDRIEKKLDIISFENEYNSSRSKSKLKQVQKKTNESVNDIYNKKVMLNKINNYNLGKNELGVGYKKKNQNKSVNKRKTSNNNFMEKIPKKQINKHENIFHNYNLVM